MAMVRQVGVRAPIAGTLRRTHNGCSTGPARTLLLATRFLRDPALWRMGPSLAMLLRS